MLRLSEQQHKRRESAAHSERRLSRLVLIGFMGAGKSTVGPLLAEALGWRFLDLDSRIEASCRRSIAEIFREHGEAYFRRKEREALEHLHGERKIVLALGGGTVEDKVVLSYLLEWEESCVVFLDAPLPELLARIRTGSQANPQDGPVTRPLLTTTAELETRLGRRLPHYRAAHVTVLTSGLAPHEVAAQVLGRVGLEARGKSDDPRKE